MSHRFYTVDVFAREKYAGNQLAVVTDATGLDAEEMQSIAAEMDYSETTFVTGNSEDGSWPVRIFTPTDEVPFAGHPTLGTAAVIRQYCDPERPDQVTLNLQVGEVPVERREQNGWETLWMRQQPPEFGDTLAHGDLARVLGLSVDDFDDSVPIQIVSTGLPTVIVPLRDRAALEGITLDRDAYDELVDDHGAKLIHAFCPEPRDSENDIAARMFAPALGVFEDPATGSANGCLAAYLSKRAYFGSSAVDASVEQGYEIGRPSLLHLGARESDGETTVEVGGNVVTVSRGELL